MRNKISSGTREPHTLCSSGSVYSTLIAVDFLFFGLSVDVLVTRRRFSYSESSLSLISFCFDFLVRLRFDVLDALLPLLPVAVDADADFLFDAADVAFRIGASSDFFKRILMPILLSVN